MRDKIADKRFVNAPTPLAWGGEESDLEFSRQYSPSRRGSYCEEVGKRKISSGKIVVYLVNKREGEEIVDTPLGFRNVMEKEVVICGYRHTPLIGNRKVQIIPESEREFVRKELSDVLKSAKESYFWNN